MAMSEIRHRKKRVPLSEFLPGHVSIEEAATKLGLSYTQVWRYVVSGELAAIETPIGYAIKQAELDAFTPHPKGNPAFRTQQNPAILKMKQLERKRKAAAARRKKRTG